MVEVGGREGHSPHSSSYFWLSIASSVQISFSPQPFTAIKIRDGGHNFCKGNREHFLANPETINDDWKDCGS